MTDCLKSFRSRSLMLLWWTFLAMNVGWPWHTGTCTEIQNFVFLLGEPINLALSSDNLNELCKASFLGTHPKCRIWSSNPLQETISHAHSLRSGHFKVEEQLRQVCVCFSCRLRSPVVAYWAFSFGSFEPQFTTAAAPPSHFPATMTGLAQKMTLWEKFFNVLHKARQSLICFVQFLV